MSETYVVATIKSWNISNFEKYFASSEHKWVLITDPGQLSLDRLSELSPKYVFFPHWSWIVPAEILQKFSCVCFHMTDVPYGRGGSPLQNLIVRGHTETKVTALKMVEQLDAGPIYMKRDLSLSGSAQEIFKRASDVIFEMIQEIVHREPEPLPQCGEVSTFKRRTRAESEMPSTGSLADVYDHIRMLDAEGYPKAFIRHGDFLIEFDSARLSGPTVSACARITKVNENES